MVTVALHEFKAHCSFGISGGTNQDTAWAAETLIQRQGEGDGPKQLALAQKHAVQSQHMTVYAVCCRMPQPAFLGVHCTHAKSALILHSWHLPFL